MKYTFYLSVLLTSCLLTLLLSPDYNGNSLAEKTVVKMKKVLNAKPTTTEKTDDCNKEGTECWKGWHYGPEPVVMEAPYIDADTDVSDFVEFTKDELEMKRSTPSQCIRCVVTEDPNSWMQ